MTKSLRTHEYTILRQELVARRERQGMTQRELAEALGVVKSWVSNVETGDRRIDLVEVIWICEALGLSPVAEVTKIVRKMSQ